MPGFCRTYRQMDKCRPSLAVLIAASALFTAIYYRDAVARNSAIESAPCD